MNRHTEKELVASWSFAFYLGKLVQACSVFDGTEMSTEQITCAAEDLLSSLGATIEFPSDDQDAEDDKDENNG